MFSSASYFGHFLGVFGSDSHCALSSLVVNFVEHIYCSQPRGTNALYTLPPHSWAWTLLNIDQRLLLSLVCRKSECWLRSTI